MARMFPFGALEHYDLKTQQLEALARARAAELCHPLNESYPYYVTFFMGMLMANQHNIHYTIITRVPEISFVDQLKFVQQQIESDLKSLTVDVHGEQGATGRPWCDFNPRDAELKFGKKWEDITCKYCQDAILANL